MDHEAVRALVVAQQIVGVRVHARVGARACTRPEVVHARLLVMLQNVVVARKVERVRTAVLLQNRHQVRDEYCGVAVLARGGRVDGEVANDQVPVGLGASEGVVDPRELLGVACGLHPLLNRRLEGFLLERLHQGVKLTLVHHTAGVVIMHHRRVTEHAAPGLGLVEDVGVARVEAPRVNRDNVESGAVRAGHLLVVVQLRVDPTVRFVGVGHLRVDAGVTAIVVVVAGADVPRYLEGVGGELVLEQLLEERVVDRSHAIIIHVITEGEDELR
mmetsp:Transcript_72565/g.206655  ORF Transcript_72565/g.206655 Transcript_72565/m.206655 type:complete len:273 (-) Transcript_72565:352-1170(-)